MSWTGVAMAVGAIGSAVIGSKASGKASGASERGAEAALAQNEEQFIQSLLSNILLNAPSINTGNVARAELAGLLGLDVSGINYGQYGDLFSGVGDAGGTVGQAFGALQGPGAAAIDPAALEARIMGTPGLAFAIEQATKNVLGQSRALGLGESGAAISAVGDRVGQGLLFPAYQDYATRLASLAGGGTGSSSNLAANIANASAQSGALNAGLIQNAANTRASGILGQGEAWGGALNQLGSIAGDYFGNRNTGGATISNPNYNWANAPAGTNWQGGVN